MENTANHITLCGVLHTLPAFSHQNHERNFYRFTLAVERLSGAQDLLNVIAAEDVLDEADLFSGMHITVSGQIRSFNRRHESGRHLIVSVYADSVTTTDLPPENSAALTGVICKPAIFRRTPLGREICDIMLAVPRLYHRTDYIPCILWGKTAQTAAACPVGTRLRITGRLQSREYTKILPTGSEKRTTYELSAAEATPVTTEDAEIF